MHLVCRPSSKTLKDANVFHAPRMVKALGISECSKVNKSILYVGPHQRPFLKIQMFFYLLLHSEWSKLWAFRSVVR